jgi:hypothetical protein
MDLTFALLWMGIGGVHLYRSYSAAMSMGMATFARTLGCIGRTFLGIAFLGIGVSHFVSYAKLAHH